MLTALLVLPGLVQSALAEEVHPTKRESEVADFNITTKKSNDQIKVRLGREGATFDVFSRSGIGGATITRAMSKWPTKVILRFHLGGLESLAISNGKIKLAASVLSHSGNTKRLYLTEDGDDGEREPGTKIEVLDAAGKPITGLPGKGGYFQVAVPKALLESQPKSLELGWIDFFR